MKCIKGDGTTCEHLREGLKGGFRMFNCAHNTEVLVQLCEEDLRVNIPCPLDKEEKCQQ